MDATQTAETIKTLLGYTRDLSIIGALFVVAWRARGIWDTVTEFIKKIQDFMTTMTTHADTLVNNHIKHLEESGTRIEKTLAEQNDLLTTISKTGRRKK